MERNLEIIIKENEALCTVGIRFEKENGFVGDYEKFECTELTNEQIIGAVQRLMEKLLPLVPGTEDPIMVAGEGKSCGKFKLAADGKFVPA